MSEFNLINKITKWYNFSCTICSDRILLHENGINATNYEFSCVADALKSFYEIMMKTNQNLQVCNYKMWSDEELAFIAGL